VSYTVFARKYRPQTFDEVVGQDHIVRTLKNAIAQNRLAQAYLFVGPRGTGKTSTARIFAKALNCTGGPKADFDPNDPICQEIADGRSMNVLEFDAASHTQVDKIREIIIDNAKYAPAGTAKYKVYIVDEVHMLSTASFNALLKTLEEPPAHVKFVFATTDVQKVPTTIISRCQRFDLKRISMPLIRDHLLMIAGKEGVALSAAAAEAVARGAEGGLRDAESMLDQLVAFCGEKIEEEDVLSVFGFTARQAVADLCEHLIAGNNSEALRAIHAQAEAGKDLSRLMSDLIEHLRNLLVAQSAAEGLQDELSAEAVAALAGQAARIAPDKLLSLIEQFGDAEGRMKWAANKKTHFEIAAIRAIQTLSQATLTEVLDTLAALRGGGSIPSKAAASKVPAVTASPVAAPISKKPEPTAPAPAPKGASFEESKLPAPMPAPVAKVREESVVESAAKTDAAVAGPVVEELWPKLIARVRKDRALISAWVESGKLVEIANGVAVLAFPPEADMARESCNRANNRSFLEALLSELAGQPLTLKCEKRDGLVVDKLAREETKSEAPVDPMEAFKNDPLIQKALIDFKAEILPA
jgi:DNA polymerase-3 subunit gamma/tau